MLMKAFYTASTQHIQQTDLSICYVTNWENDSFHVFKNANVSVNSVISNVLAVSLSIDILARFVSLSSAIVGSVKRFNQPELAEAPFSSIAHSSDRQTLVRMNQNPFPWEAKSKFCLYFSGCWRCNVNGSSQSDCSILRQ